MEEPRWHLEIMFANTRKIQSLFCQQLQSSVSSQSLLLRPFLLFLTPFSFSLDIPYARSSVVSGGSIAPLAVSLLFSPLFLHIQ